MEPTARELISRLELIPHPEGGHYREVHRSSRSLGVLPGYPGERVALTAIYFLLAAGEVSAFHRVRSEEVWIHLGGGALELVLLDRVPAIVRLSGVEAGGGTQLAVVPPDRLQAARPLGDWVLAVCLVAPGFEFSDFELPDCDELRRTYPDHAELISVFAR